MSRACLVVPMMLLLAAACMPAYSLELITPMEAALPQADEINWRSVTLGPTVTVEQPTGALLRSPLQIKVSFRPHGGAKIDLKSLQLTYLKTPAVDLTPRLRAGISATGINVSDIALPPGKHRILLHLADSDGRETDSVLTLDIAP